MKHKILFICLGNICRSPAAEGIMRSIVEEHSESDKWEIDSAGIGGWHVGQLPDSRMRAHARRRGLELTHHCRQVITDDFLHYDLIIGMDAQNLSDLHELSPSPETDRKIVSMMDYCRMATRYDHIPDPYYEGAEGFELVLDLLQDACQGLYDSSGE